MINVLQTENTCFLYLTCSMQGEHIFYNLFSAGGVFVHTTCHHQKEGECWNLDFDDNICDANALELISKTYTEF